MYADPHVMIVTYGGNIGWIGIFEGMKPALDHADKLMKNNNFRQEDDDDLIIVKPDPTTEGNETIVWSIWNS